MFAVDVVVGGADVVLFEEVEPTVRLLGRVETPGGCCSDGAVVGAGRFVVMLVGVCCVGFVVECGRGGGGGGGGG